MSTIDPMIGENHLQIYEEARPRLLSLAYRMTGSYSDSEDILQDAYLKFNQVPFGKIKSAGALLRTIVTRLSIDFLRSARRKKEIYVGPWLPEPVPDLYLAHENPEDRESIRFAFLLLLQKLNPVERAVFILREIFDYDYSEISKITQRNIDNCRQIFHRAKKNVRSDYEVKIENEERNGEILSAFLAACSGKNLETLVNLLQRDAVFISDGGGKAKASRIPIRGARRIAKFLFAVRDKNGSDDYYIGHLNNALALVGYFEKRPVFVHVFEVSAQGIGNSYAIRNPDKLRLFSDFEKLVRAGDLIPLRIFFKTSQKLRIAREVIFRKITKWI